MPRHHPTQYVRSSLAADNGWKSVLGPTVRRFQKLWDQNCNKKSYGTKFRPLPKLWDQIETFVKVMGPKVNFSQKNTIKEDTVPN